MPRKRELPKFFRGVRVTAAREKRKMQEKKRKEVLRLAQGHVDSFLALINDDPSVGEWLLEGNSPFCGYIDHVMQRGVIPDAAPGEWIVPEPSLTPEFLRGLRERFNQPTVTEAAKPTSTGARK